MKDKTLTEREAKRRFTETLTEVTSSLFRMSPKEAKEKFNSAPQDEKDFALAGFVHFMNERLESTVRRGKAKRRYTVQEVEETCKKVKAAAPQIATEMRKGMKDLRTKMLRSGGPGRTGILTAQEQLEVVEQIGSLYKTGKMKKWADIFAAVAVNIKATKQKKISARSLKRLWEKREALYAG